MDILSLVVSISGKLSAKPERSLTDNESEAPRHQHVPKQALFPDQSGLFHRPTYADVLDSGQAEHQ